MYRNSEKEKEVLTSNEILSPACINRKNQLPFMRSIGLQPKLKITISKSVVLKVKQKYHKGVY